MDTRLLLGYPTPMEPTGTTGSRIVHAFRDDAMGDADTVELARRVTTREVSLAEVVEAAIARARSVNGELNAIVHETFDEALAAARAGGPNGRFAGLPSFIKDTDAVAGTPLRFGSHALPDRPSRKSSPFVRQFLATGLTCLGKSSLPELGLTATTEPRRGGPTRNPWNTAHSTGGSSGGSSALVAAGVVTIAHANDGGGSIRIPASCCGLVGFKASRGRLVGAEGGAMFPIDIIVQGAVTRTVRDAAAFLAAAEAARPSRRLAPLGLVEGPGRERLRIGVFTESAAGDPSHPDCHEAVARTAAVLGGLGHHVEWIRCPFGAELVDDFFAYWGFAPFGLGLVGRLVFGRGYDHSRLEPWSRGLADHFRSRLRSFPRVLGRLRRFARDYDDLFRRWDVILTPTLSAPPLPIGSIGPDVPFATAVARVTSYAAFTPAQNLSGGAAVSLPLGMSAGGLPVGVHLGGNTGSDARLLGLAYELEAAMPWPTLATTGPGSTS